MFWEITKQTKIRKYRSSSIFGSYKWYVTKIFPAIPYLKRQLYNMAKWNLNQADLLLFSNWVTKQSNLTKYLQIMKYNFYTSVKNSHSNISQVYVNCECPYKCMLSNKENPINSSYSKSQLKNCVPWDMCQSHCISLSQQCNCPSKASVHKTITYQVLVIRSTMELEFEKQHIDLTLKFIELLQEKISFLYKSRLKCTTNYFFSFSLYMQKFNYTKIKAVYVFFIQHLRLSFHQFST